MSKREFRPLSEAPAPSYPTSDGFEPQRRRFLLGLAAGVGLALLGGEAGAGEKKEKKEKGSSKKHDKKRPPPRTHGVPPSHDGPLDEGCEQGEWEDMAAVDADPDKKKKGKKDKKKPNPVPRPGRPPHPHAAIDEPED